MKAPLNLGNNSAIVQHAAALRQDSKAARKAAQEAREKARDYRIESRSANMQAKNAIIQSALDQNRLDLVCINPRIVEALYYSRNNVPSSVLAEMRGHMEMAEKLGELIKKLTDSKRIIVRDLRSAGALQPELFNLSPAALKEF